VKVKADVEKPSCGVNGTGDLTKLEVRELYNRERKCADNYIKQHNEFIFKAAISILVIRPTNHNGFRVLFDKIASVYYFI